MDTEAPVTTFRPLSLRSQPSPSPAATGDESTWHALTPAVWAAVADPAGVHALPSLDDGWGDPHKNFGGTGPTRFAMVAGAYSSCIQLLLYSLAWPVPHVAMDRWLAQGQPREDPRLNVVARLVGHEAGHFADFLWSGKGRQITEQLRLLTQASFVEGPRLLRRPSPPPAAYRLFGDGGSDSLHLYGHSGAPITHEPPGTPPPLLIAARNAGDRTTSAALLLDKYAGWYSGLTQVSNTRMAAEPTRSLRVDVVVKPVGWLGTFRRSRQSGLWFAGRHRWHQLGIP